jgi:hypothetical protein
VVTAIATSPHFSFAIAEIFVSSDSSAPSSTIRPKR